MHGAGGVQQVGANGCVGTVRSISTWSSGPRTSSCRRIMRTVLNAACRLKSYEGKLATLSVINGALQNENDKLRAVRNVSNGMPTSAVNCEAFNAWTSCDPLFDHVRQCNSMAFRCRMSTCCVG